MMLQGREIMVPVWPSAAATAAMPPRLSILKTVEAAARAMRILFHRYGADAVVYGFPAAAWASGVGVGVLGHWAFRERSATEGAGDSLGAVTKFVALLLILTFLFVPLFTTRVLRQHVEFEVNKEERREKHLWSPPGKQIASLPRGMSSQPIQAIEIAPVKISDDVIPPSTRIHDSSSSALADDKAPYLYDYALKLRATKGIGNSSALVHFLGPSPDVDPICDPYDPEYDRNPKIARKKQ